MKLYSDLLDASRVADDGKPKDFTGAAPRLPFSHIAKGITLAIPRAVPFDFTAADEWLDKTDVGIGTFVASLPTCVAPYPVLFAEVTHTEKSDGAAGSSGALMLTEPLEDGSGFRAVAYSYVRFDADRWYGPLLRLMLNYDAEGRIQTVTQDPNTGEVFDSPKPVMQFGELPPFDVRDPADEEKLEVMQRDAVRTLCATFFGCALLHCNNVGEQHERLPRPEARKRERDGLPAVVWKTLAVDPMPKPKTPTEVGDALDERAVKRLHLVRGHFREYGTEGRGLLSGRIAGRFWIPPTAKGSASEGLVVKSYRLAPKGK